MKPYRGGNAFGLTVLMLLGSCSLSESKAPDAVGGAPSIADAATNESESSGTVDSLDVGDTAPYAGSPSGDRRSSDGESPYPSGQASPPANPETAAILGKQLLAYDESIPMIEVEYYWYLKDDLEELSRTSALGFTGRVTGYVEGAMVLPSAAEVPADDQGYDVYDGIVFTVDELLVGSLPPNKETVTVVVRRLFLNSDRTPRFRLSSSLIETVDPGIASRNTLDGPTYIVYVTEEDETRSPFYDSGYYFFNTPGGVAPMLDGGKIGNAADRPLAPLVVVEDGGYRRTGHELTLKDARAVARALEAEAGQGEWVPASPFGVGDSDETGPVGVTG